MKTKTILGYVGGAVLGLIAAALLVSFAIGFFQGFVSSSSPGDPSAAGVVDGDPVWSPDSRFVAFHRSDYGSPDDPSWGASDVFVASGADGRGLRRLTRTPESETVLGWLANPPRVVYSSHEPRGRTYLFALVPGGGPPVRLGAIRAADQLLALSHGARRALVGTPWSDPKRYALVDLVRHTRRPLPGIASDWADGAWSPDDFLLAYLAGDSIVVLQGDRILRRVRLGRYDSASGGLAWSPDGGRLAYGSSWDVDESSLWLVRVEDGSRSLLVESDDSSSQYPLWSPDGSTIYFEHGSYDDHDGLRAIAPDGTDDRKITSDDWGFLGTNERWLDRATISPDGKRIAYLLSEAGHWKHWSLVGVMNVDGSGKTPFPGSDRLGS